MKLLVIMSFTSDISSITIRFLHIKIKINKCYHKKSIYVTVFFFKTNIQRTFFKPELFLLPRLQYFQSHKARQLALCPLGSWRDPQNR